MRWLAMKGQRTAALRVLAPLRSSRQESLQEIDSVETALRQNQGQRQSDWDDLTQPWIRQ